MQMATNPKLSRDLQRHLGRELGAIVGRTAEEPLTGEMEQLLERLRQLDTAGESAGRRPMGRPTEA